MRSITSAIVGAVAATAILTGSLAIAAIPDSTTKVITVCYTKTSGTLRVIDKQAKATCNPKTEIELSWNQQGVKGDQGPQGLLGAAGPAGANGQNGFNGLNGLNGLNGAAGPVGVVGNNGTNGINGAPGVKGDTGQPGSNGIDGAPGPAGANGVDGSAGAAGADGVAGLPGPGVTTIAGTVAKSAYSNAMISTAGSGFVATWDQAPGPSGKMDLVIDYPAGTWTSPPVVMTGCCFGVDDVTSSLTQTRIKSTFFSWFQAGTLSFVAVAAG